MLRDSARALRLFAYVALLTSAVAIGEAAESQPYFQIVWVVIGEAATSDGDVAPRVGRHVFMAPELVKRSLQNVQVARVDVLPEVTTLIVGDRVCLTSLIMRAYAKDGQLIQQAPLSIAIRQDHKERLALHRSTKDVCLQPAVAGEYPIRFTSLLPAADGSVRGAQVFLRVAAVDEKVTHDDQ